MLDSENTFPIVALLTKSERFLLIETLKHGGYIRLAFPNR